MIPGIINYVSDDNNHNPYNDYDENYSQDEVAYLDGFKDGLDAYPLNNILLENTLSFHFHHSSNNEANPQPYENNNHHNAANHGNDDAYDNNSNNYNDYYDN